MGGVHKFMGACQPANFVDIFGSDGVDCKSHMLVLECMGRLGQRFNLEFVEGHACAKVEGVSFEFHCSGRIA